MTAAFRFGNSSQDELVGVAPALVVLCYRTLELSPVDFAVHDGVRTIEEQREYVRRGVSQTMNSRHLPVHPNDDTSRPMRGHAVDLVPYLNGKLRWEWEPIYKVAAAMHKAAEELNIALVWGGVWDRAFRTLNPAQLDKEVEGYVARRKRQRKKAFIDGPHFQLA